MAVFRSSRHATVLAMIDGNSSPRLWLGSVSAHFFLFLVYVFRTCKDVAMERSFDTSLAFVNKSEMSPYKAVNGAANGNDPTTDEPYAGTWQALRASRLPLPSRCAIKEPAHDSLRPARTWLSLSGGLAHPSVKVNN
ncbi:hypothetical protein GE21DRAFT_1202546 [Neurospora crassa]|nr:hypothetical protein B2O8.300 [imported] - Neurospora crassa [Neurospora crassa]KHE87127.1 hypothetical protein GE21DRAFT_1202546 [Neurospora crassa]